MEHEEVVEAVVEWFKRQPHIILVKKGRGEFPDPDVFAQDKKSKITFVECKPSGSSGREYLTGLGQAIAYTTLSNFSFLAIPQKEMVEYRKYFVVETIGLLSVTESGDVTIVKKAREGKPKFKSIRDRSYGYYRDLKSEEIYEILKTIYSAQGMEDRIKDSIWKTLCKMRELKSERQKTGWLLNVKLLLRDLGLINEDMSLTKNGLTLLQLGASKNKDLYIKELTRCFLVNANYIDILSLIQELNNKYNAFISVGKFKELLAKKIIEEKLATENTNVMRDLQDILRILRDLGVITEWSTVGHLGGRFNINLKKVSQFLK
jgi:hypothetical protein